MKAKLHNQNVRQVFELITNTSWRNYREWAQRQGIASHTLLEGENILRYIIHKNK